MSLLSRNTGGERRKLATAAGVFAGTLLTYLVVAAIPAMAVTTCSPGPVAGSRQITTDPDDRIIVAGTPAGWIVLEDGAAAPTPGCAAAAWLNITGSDAGQETVVFYLGPLSPGQFGAAAITVNLGNGTDTVIFEYGDTTWNSSGGPVALPDSGNNDALGLGTSGTGTVASTNGVGGAGDVLLTNVETLTAFGGTGNDTVDAGNISDLTAKDLLATTTADNIPAATTPLAANLTFNGEPGIDTLTSGNGNDTFNGAQDADVINYQGSTAGVTVDLGAGTATGMGNDVLNDVQAVFGSDFADKLTGSSIDNTLSGEDGPDTIDGAAGNDTEVGGAGDDTFNQGAAPNGADLLDGSFGNCFGTDTTEINGDWLNYGARTTATVVRANGAPVSGQDANVDGDAADAGDERDTVLATFENISTGTAVDTIVGSALNCEWMTPGAGSDTVDGVGFADGFNFDVLDESDQTGPTTMTLAGLGPLGGPNGQATATVGADTDKASNIEGYSGTEEDDTVVWDGVALMAPPGGGTLHNEFAFYGYGGVDTVDASTATRGVVLDLSAIRPGGLDRDDLENAIGGSGADTLVGNVLNNELIGNDGADTINAGNGNDFVEGGQGNDSLIDGGGGDKLSYKNAPSGVTVDTANGFASGGDGDDSISGIFETVLGSDFNDTIIAGQTAFDVPNLLKGRGGNDSLTGSNSTDTLSGGGGNDQLRMGGGDDTGKGNKGNDLILAGAGDDVLKGGKGNDEGDGGKGHDVCTSVEDQTSC